MKCKQLFSDRDYEKRGYRQHEVGKYYQTENKAENINNPFVFVTF